jgi:tetratricopeptide (TPR) repeat protein
MTPESASELLPEAADTVAASRQCGDKPALAKALTRLGYIERQLRQLEAARGHYQEAAAIHRASGDTLALAHAIRHVGDIHMEAGRFDLAGPNHLEALGLYRRESAPPALDLANAIRSLAVLKEKTGSKAEAKPLWREARGIYLILNIEAGVAECDRRLSCPA